MNSNPPDLVLVTDIGVARAGNTAVLLALKSFVDYGGNPIIAGNFSSSVLSNEADHTFKAIKLPWKRGDYYRTDVEYRSPLDRAVDGMPPFYSQKAVFLQGVDTSSEFWTYQPARGATTQSNMFPPYSTASDQRAAIGCSHGFGFVSYLGDVNSGVEASRAVL